MKKLIMLLAALIMFCGITYAAPKSEKKIVTVVYTTDIHCANCAKKVENSIPYEKGIKDMQIDVAKKTVTIKYDASKTNQENILKAFESIKVKVLKTNVID
ncbi:MAG: cation transporter [Alistipes sp.]|nr:cation transporter [Candidatus Alistipes equi]